MALSSDDRKAFSLKIVNADTEVALYTQAKAQLTTEVAKLQSLDDANKNLFDPVNVLTNRYQLEYTALDGKTRTTFTEDDIQNSAKIVLGNFFFPNNVNAVVPSLASSNNVWTKPKPFALTYAIGKNYSEAQPIITNESDIINTVVGLINGSTSNLPIELATGEMLQTFTPPTPSTLVPNPTVIQLKNDMVTAITSMKSLLLSELTNIVNDDKNPTIQAQNNAAIADINNNILPAVNTWLGYVDFNTAGVTAGNFLSFNAATLAPTKLSAVQMTALKTALTTRLTFITARLGQLNTVIGTITQNLTDGSVLTSSGLCGKRYSLLLLRLDLLNGSLSKLFSLKNAASAQDSIISSIKANKATYLTVVPTSAFASPGNDTSTIQAVDGSFFSQGDTVWVMAEGQDELQRAIKSINGNVIVLNDIVPAKYKTTNQLRIYKDNT